MSCNIEDEKSITELGNPRKPQGDAGMEMLTRMNESHSNLTGWALGFFNWNENDRVLDIGCGGGAALKRMSEYVPHGKLTGADYSEVSVAASEKNNADDINSGKMKIVFASVEKLPFESESFDKILTVESFYFWPNPVENLKEVRRVLAESGTFLLAADIYGRSKFLSESDIENIKKYDLFNPTPEEFLDMFRSAGFSSVQVHMTEENSFICVEGRK